MFSSATARWDRALLNTLLATSDEAVVAAATDRRVTRVGGAFFEMFGYEDHEVLGRPTLLLYAEPEDFGHAGAYRFNERSTVGIVRHTVLYRRRDGTTFLGATLGNRICSSRGDTLGYIGLVRLAEPPEAG